jgi:cell division protein WhiA
VTARKPAAFGSRVKAELARLEAPRACCRRSELLALVRSAGTFHILPGGLYALEVEAPDASVARTIYRALASLQIGAEVRLLQPGRGRPAERFVVRVSSADRRIFIRAGALDARGRFTSGVPRSVRAKRCCSGAYLRGAFICRGSISEPRSPAHVEIRAPDRAAAAGIAALAGRVGGRAKVRAHRGWAAYAKDVASIGRLLAAMGAHQGYLEWEQGSVFSAVRSDANRLANADEANIGRVVRASVAQRAAIREIESSRGLRSLTPALREVARARLAHPDASLSELARRLGVSKAGVADRLRRLMALGPPPPRAHKR